MNICISFQKKTFWNQTDNGTAEAQDEFLCFFFLKFESRPKLANDELVRKSARLKWTYSLMVCVIDFFEYKNIMLLK
jgi:hypothetical protein